MRVITSHQTKQAIASAMANVCTCHPFVFKKKTKKKGRIDSPTMQETMTSSFRRRSAPLSPSRALSLSSARGGQEQVTRSPIAQAGAPARRREGLFDVVFARPPDEHWEKRCGCAEPPCADPLMHALGSFTRWVVMHALGSCTRWVVMHALGSFTRWVVMHALGSFTRWVVMHALGSFTRWVVMHALGSFTRWVVMHALGSFTRWVVMHALGSFTRW
eukprot:gene5094-56024_t